ncbi:hypothetical protein E2C01_025499 [Portunus trituberculatus]|uniref:Uncharacterized protein n=1 Tax=Portunus trituberculatus TaxID=210409 RepID=A0A5B7EI38_PORTR|nr:hypothetical protein [Portunus trituberculatus]
MYNARCVDKEADEAIATTRCLPFVSFQKVSWGPGLGRGQRQCAARLPLHAWRSSHCGVSMFPSSEKKG